MSLIYYPVSRLIDPYHEYYSDKLLYLCATLLTVPSIRQGLQPRQMAFCHSVTGSCKEAR